MLNPCRLAWAAIVAAVLFSSAQAEAASFSFTGNFQNDNDIVLFNFTLAAPGTVTMVTLGYAGGTNAAGSPIAADGFDPIVTLYDGAGNILNQNDDGGASVPANPSTNFHLDSFLQESLVAGSYTVALTQWDNLAFGPTLADGFMHGDPADSNFTAGFGCSNGAFCDVLGNNLDSHWALDILGADSASGPTVTPVPAALPLFGSALGTLGLLGWCRNRKSTAHAA